MCLVSSPSNQTAVPHHFPWVIMTVLSEAVPQPSYQEMCSHILQFIMAATLSVGMPVLANFLYLYECYFEERRAIVRERDQFR